MIEDVPQVASHVRSLLISQSQIQIVEVNAPAEFFAHPKHERTKLFLSQILN